MKFYKYASFHSTKLILDSNSLMYTNPMDFNDPFDVAPTYTNEGANKFYNNILGEYRMKDKRFGKKRIEYLKYLKPSFMEAFKLNVISVTCFSSSPFILPMWAHYGDNHKGCVLEFTLTEQLKKELIETRKIPDDVIFPMDVIYTKSRPKIYNINGEMDMEHAKKILLSKDKAWSYEEEKRDFIHKKSGIYSFRPEQLTRVYCGLKMPTDDEMKLKEHISNYRSRNGVTLRFDKLYLDNHEYKVGRL